jgi:hypothetical protein
MQPRSFAAASLRRSTVGRHLRIGAACAMLLVWIHRSICKLLTRGQLWFPKWLIGGLRSEALWACRRRRRCLILSSPLLAVVHCVGTDRIKRPLISCRLTNRDCSDSVVCAASRLCRVKIAKKRSSHPEICLPKSAVPQCVPQICPVQVSTRLMVGCQCQPSIAGFAFAVMTQVTSYHVKRPGRRLRATGGCH